MVSYELHRDYMFVFKFDVFSCQHLQQEKIEDTRSHQWKTDRQHNGQKNKNKRTNNDLQYIII